MANVTLDHVSKTYGGMRRDGVLAVNDLTLQCNDKELLAIIGPSGCGKSTTLRMIAGLENITSGNIFIGKTSVKETHPKDLNLAMVFENYALYPHLNVFDNMALNLKIRKIDKRDIERKIADVSKVLEIEDILKSNVQELSSGQKQRVSLGRAIVRSPAVFCVDEPLSHVDVRVRIVVRSEIKKLFKKLEATVIYVTHSQEDAIALADRIAVMNHGKLQQVGTADELYEHPANVFVAGFVGQPAINFIEGKLESSNDKIIFKSDFGVVDVPQGKLKLSNSNDCILGIRPIHLTVSDDKKNTNFIAKVSVVTYNGDSSLLHVKREDNLVRIRVPGFFRATTGDSVGITVQKDKLILFDRYTGNSIT
jgi:multiple sugar transport system ATP-binding protein